METHFPPITVKGAIINIAADIGTYEIFATVAPFNVWF